MKKGIMILFVILLLSAFSLASFADAAEELSPDDYLDEVCEAMPEEVKAELSKKQGTIFGVEDLVTLGEVVLKTLSSQFLPLFGKCLVMILFASLFQSLWQLSSRQTAFFDWLFLAVSVSLLLPEILSLGELSLLYLKKMQTFLGTVASILGGVLLYCGNALSSSTLLATLTSLSFLIESGCLAFLLPTVKLSLTASLAGHFGERAIASLGNVIEKVYQRALGAVMFFSVLLLTYQSILTLSEDTLATKTLRYAVSSSIPIVGGAVGESFHTLTASVNVIRTSVGSLGVAALLLLALYPLTSLLSVKAALSLSEVLCRMLSLDRESALFASFHKTVGMLVSVVIMTSLLFIFTLSLFMLLPTALGG